MRNTIFAAAAAAVLAASPAFAEEISVSAAGLDLSSPAGISALDSRIANAVNQVCTENGLMRIERVSREAQCRADAMRTAASQRDALIGRTTLAAGTSSTIRAAR